MSATAFPAIPLTGPVGKPLVRRSGRGKVTGTATYTAEWPVDGLLHAVAVPSTIARGTVTSIDTSAAEAMAGVRLVLTPDTAPDVTEIGVFQKGAQANATTVQPVAGTEVFHAGQYLAAVVADTFEAARDAALAVKIAYDPADHVTDLAAVKDSDERPESLMGAPPVITEGDAEQALREAEVSVDVEFPTAMNHHNPIEPHATVAEFGTNDAGERTLLVYDTTQNLGGVRADLAKMFGLKPANVRVVCKFVGGAFGSKGAMWPNAILAAKCAEAAGAPVKFVVTRRQLYGGTGHRTPILQRVALGAKRDGTLTAILHEGVQTTARTDVYGEAFTTATRMMYAAPHRRLAQTMGRVDTQKPTFMRAPAETPGMFALEEAIDEMAEAVGLDPIEFRKRNEPRIAAYEDKPFSDRRLIGCLERGAEAFGWADRNPEPRSMRDGNWLIGYGVAAATYPAFFFPTSAKVTLNADGTVLVTSATHELGTGTATAQAQLAADLLGIPAERVTFKLGDTNYPKAGVSGGSATTGSVGGAVRNAIEKLKGALLTHAAGTPIAGTKPDDLRFENGRLVATDGTGVATLEELVAASMKSKLSAEGKFAPGDLGYAAHSFGATFVEVAVDEEFGLVRVRRMLGCYACGTILNAKTARSQFLGGMIMGLGHALEEVTHWDHGLGRVTNDNLAEYHVPVNADVPDVTVMWDAAPDYNASPIGAKGIGEIGITGVAAAFANAVYHATGKRQRELPITPERVMV